MPKETLYAAKKYVEAKPNATVWDLMKDLGISKSRATIALYDLSELGLYSYAEKHLEDEFNFTRASKVVRNFECLSPTGKKMFLDMIGKK